MTIRGSGEALVQLDTERRKLPNQCDHLRRTEIASEDQAIELCLVQNPMLPLEIGVEIGRGAIDLLHMELKFGAKCMIGTRRRSGRFYLFGPFHPRPDKVLSVSKI